MNFKISIIIPIYNVELFLRRSVDSVIDQSYKNLEIILVDDGSSDSCPQICDEYLANDSRIKVIHKENGGLSSARNEGIYIASGEYLGFVDGDDYIENDMYEKLLSACINNNAAISMCGRFNCKEDGTIIPVFTLPRQEVWSGKQAISNLLVYNNIDSSACDKLFRRELFINIHFPIGKICEDIFIIPKIISKCELFVHICEAKYFYTQRTGSISHTEFSPSTLNMLDAHLEVSNFIKLEYPDLYQKADSFYFRAFIFLYKGFYCKKAFDEYPNLKQMVDNLAHLNFFPILTNKYVPIRKKIMFILVYLKIFKPILQIRALLH